METDDRYERWAKDSVLLGQIGRALFTQPAKVTVRLPKELAAEALRSWQRGDNGRELPESESPEQRTARHRAGTLGLIGLAIEQRGTVDGDEFVVELDAWEVGNALEAADQMDLLGGLIPPPSGSSQRKGA